MWKKLRRAQVLIFWPSARLSVYGYLFLFDYALFVNFNLHLGGKATFLSKPSFSNASNPMLNKSSWTFFFGFFSTWRFPLNRSKPPKLVPVRRLLRRRDQSTSRGKATGVAAARGPTAPSTRKIAHGASKKSRPSKTRLFIRLCLPNNTSIDPVTTPLRSLIAVSASLLAV